VHLTKSLLNSWISTRVLALMPILINYEPITNMVVV
jgi:hypothetical protein